MSNRALAKEMENIVRRTGNTAPLLPLLFSFNGQPVTLDQHYQFEPFFTDFRPRRMQKRCGRQVGKSLQNAFEALVRLVRIKHWNSLYVTPMFEQVRRFSTQYIASLIEQSPVRDQFTLKGGSAQVLQRTMKNRSTMFFTYALRDANRARGINVNEVNYDEIQLMLRDVMPVLREAMGGSKYGEYETYSGTPLSPQNFSEELFRQSTMSEWMIKCSHCGYDNIASIEYDLIKMIGPYHPDIGPGNPGLVCAKCSPHNNVKNLKTLFPETGHWWHRFPERRADFLGVHIPQPIMEWHAKDRSRWLQLNNRVRNMDISVYNEVLGETADSSFKPITVEQLQRAACLPTKNVYREAIRLVGNYTAIALGVDWGGYGVDKISRTKAAIVGLTPTGKTDVLFGIDMNASHNPMLEMRALMVLAKQFGAQLIAHDVGGNVGATHETMMIQSGILQSEIWPMSYHGTLSGTMMKVRNGTQPGERDVFIVDKAKSVMFLCQCIIQGKIRTFQYDYVSKDNTGLLYDFTSLVSEVSPRKQGSDVLLIDKETSMSDDFVHAVNFACLGLWAKYNAYPSISESMDYATLAQLADSIGGSLDPYHQYSTADIEAVLGAVVSGPLA
jgi:hypothetical protein